MDDLQVRQAVCRASHELWLRGLVAGDDGLVCVELNRRRYVVAPPGSRKADLQPQQAREVDLDGEIVGTTRDGAPRSVSPTYWRPCMLALQAAIRHDQDRRGPGPTVHACVIVQPVSLMAMMHKAGTPNPVGEVALASGRMLPIIDATSAQGEDHLKDAIGETPGILLPGVGLFVPAPTLARALNRAERLEHDAAVTLAAK